MTHVLVRTHLRLGRPVRAHFMRRQPDFYAHRAKYFDMGEQDALLGRLFKGEFANIEAYNEGYRDGQETKRIKARTSLRGRQLNDA